MARYGIRRACAHGVALLATGVLLAGCSLFGESDSTDPTGNEGGSEPSGGGEITVQVTNFAHLDPQSIGFGMWVDQQGLLEGLVLQNEDGSDVVPAVAETWDISEDQTVYTFHLREDATWSNGERVTAEHFEWTYQRLLDPGRSASGGTQGASSYQAHLGIAGANEYAAGTLTDWEQVGIKAVDESTLEITLQAPSPGFLMGLTYPSMLPLYPDAVEADEQAWQEPENWVGNGPYLPTAWTANSSMTLERNPEYWDAENVALDRINVQLLEQGAVTTTVPYENGEVDIMPVSSPGDITRFVNDPELSEQLLRYEAGQTGYLALLHSRNPALNDIRVRQALSLAIGREEVASIVETTTPASTLIPHTVEGWDESIQVADPLWGADAVAQAQDLLAEAGYPGGEGFPALTILSGQENPLIDAIVDTWQTNLGIEVATDVVEVGVYVERRAELHPEDYVGFWYGSFSGTNTWPYVIEQLWGPNDVMATGLPPAAYEQYVALQNNTELDAAARTTQINELLRSQTTEEARRFAELVDEAKAAASPEDQAAAYKAAATAREQALLYLPSTWNDILYAAQPRIEGLTLRAQAERYYFKDISVSSS